LSFLPILGVFAAAHDDKMEWVIVKGVAGYENLSRQSSNNYWMSFASTIRHVPTQLPFSVIPPVPMWLPSHYLSYRKTNNSVAYINESDPQRCQYTTGEL